MNSLAQLVAILAVLVAGARVALGQPGIQLPCERLTGIAGCIECMSTNKQCYLCQKSLTPVWSAAGQIRQCKPAVQGAACVQSSGDANCLRCDASHPAWCVECKQGFFFNSNYKCIRGSCPQISKNPGCAANGCLPDGTCGRCANANLILVPANAIYLNVAMPETKCMPLAQLNTEARELTGKNAVAPAGCIEVDTVFRCSQCRPGQSFTGGKCVPFASGNKCKYTVRFRQYCERCNPAGDRCVACNGARALVNGACSLPCKLLFGIGCLQCTATHCTRADPLFSNGRR